MGSSWCPTSKKSPTFSASAIELETIFKQLFGYVAENPSVPEKELAERNKAAEKAYRAWWNKAKESLFRNPRVACPKTKGEPYVLRAKEEEMKPEQEVLREYFLNREPKKKILLAEKLYKTATDDSVEEIKADLPKIKEELTEAIKKARSLNDADRLPRNLGQKQPRPLPLPGRGGKSRGNRPSKQGHHFGSRRGATRRTG